MHLKRELEIAEGIAREAGDVLVGFYRGEYGVDTKAGREPVTEADHAANELIVGRLREAFPRDGVLAEESVDADLVRGERLWLVDPMDGTREFIDHTNEFAVMIGLAIDGRPCLGVVNQPATRTLYRGIVGEGAECVDADGVVAMGVTGAADPSRLRLIVSRSHLPKIVDRIRQELGIESMVRSGSVGLKIGAIGTGRCDLYLHPSSGTKLWDAAAPEAILRAAGGALTDFDGRPLAYDPRNVLNERGLLASNGVIHDRLVELLSGYF